MAVIIGGPGVPELVLTASVCTPVRCLGCRILNIGCEYLSLDKVLIEKFHARYHRHVRGPTYTPTDRRRRDSQSLLKPAGEWPTLQSLLTALAPQRALIIHSSTRRWHGYDTRSPPGPGRIGRRSRVSPSECVLAITCRSASRALPPIRLEVPSPR